MSSANQALAGCLQALRLPSLQMWLHWLNQRELIRRCQAWVTPPPVLTLGQLLGFTFESPTGFKGAIGLLDEPLSDRFGGLIRPNAMIDATERQAGLFIGEFHFQVPSPPGVMIYRSVPESSTAILLVVASTALAIAKWKYCR